MLNQSDEMAIISRHVIMGECPPVPDDGITGCQWGAEDCVECWWVTLANIEAESDWRRKYGKGYM